ncbi:hypothetical protein B0T14DRAFT_568829 [Immersiella caudata]|uniref:Uncharacterized protein n=1 Tax=Immersiella caudata TaxID=314043 RepID=A0AA40BXJ8_9PEZI|nr:hypothetical protein B0T14DRAFT_568829 [Immersiella caudata]
MATGSNGDGSPYERARFYSHDEIVQERTDRAAALREIAAQGPPRPWYHLTNYWPGSSRKLLERRFNTLQRFEKDAGRPLTNREAFRLVELLGEADRIRSFSDDVSVVATWYLWHRGRAVGRFPFGFWHVPNYNAFGIGRFFVVQGQRARVMWSIARFAAYYALVEPTCGVLFNSYTTVKVVGAINSDSTLKPMLQDIHRTQEARRDARGIQRKGRPPAPAPGAAYPPLPQERVPYSQQTQAYQEPSQEPERGGDDGPSGLGDEPNYHDEPASSQPASSQSAYPPPRTSGSAWDRLRKSAATPDSGSADGGQRVKPSSWAERRQRAQQGATDSYSFSDQDQEQAAAKDQAQREFDAMLERERRNASRDS